jgi:hypothetical protein
MRISKTLIGLAAIGVLTVGCASTSSPAGSGDKAKTDSAPAPAGGSAQKAMAVAIDGPQADVTKRGAANPKVTPSPERGAPFLQQVEHALREKILVTAKVPGATSAKCPDGVTQKASAVSQCVVTYEGAEIPYEVKISDSYKEGSMITSYTVTPQKGLVVAKVVYDRLYETYGAESGRTDLSKLACEEFPVAKALDWKADTGLKCQYWSKNAKGGKGGYETLRVTMGTSSSNVGFEVVE